jgi:hypothetical protein
MNVEIGAEAAVFPEKEYIYVIFVAVYERKSTFLRLEIVFVHLIEKQQFRFSSVVLEDPPGSEVCEGTLLRILQRRERSSFH